MKQEKNNYCLCSILEHVFFYGDIFISQEEIAKNLTPAEKGFRADDDKIKNFLREKGFNYEFYWWNQTPFNEPDTLLKEIYENKGFIGIGNHAYLILEFEDPIITIIDPATEHIRDLNYYSLMQKLRKEDGFFGLIKKIN